VEQWTVGRLFRTLNDIEKGILRPDIRGLSEDTANLIRLCWEGDPRRRPTADQIFERLQRLKYKLIRGVDSNEVSFYVDSVLEREKGFPPVARRSD
jgi:hypothetical protein